MATFVHATSYGALEVAPFSAPLTKNSTLLIVPSESLAVARNANSPGAVNATLLGSGEVINTLGGTLVTGGAESLPVPVRPTVGANAAAVEGTVTTPARRPTASGANATANVQFAPGTSVTPLQEFALTRKSPALSPRTSI